MKLTSHFRQLLMTVAVLSHSYMARAQDAVPSEGESGDIPVAQRVQDVFGDDGGFPFYVPIGEAHDTATNLSYLNDAAADRKIVVKDDHFAYADTGERVRFFGVNLGVHSAFPTKESADRIAPHLARLGVNIVRLHHLDNEWARGSEGSLWIPGENHDRFNPVVLDRLDYLLSKLKEHGIYANLNLKVSKELDESDGLPTGPEGIPFPHQKRVDRFEPTFIEHQRWFARELLTHRNPYTGMTYAEDPAIPIVEINNENSIMHVWPGHPLGEGFTLMAEPYQNELRRQWNAWLADRYRDDAAIQAAWFPQRKVEAAPSLEGGWQGNGIGDAAVTLEPVDPANPSEGFTAEVTQSTGTDWHAQALLTGIALENDQTYTLRFTAAAPQDHPARVSMDSSMDYRNVGLGQSIVLTPEPRRFEMIFIGTDVDTDNRIAINLGGQTGRVRITDVDLAVGSDVQQTLGTLADRSYALPDPPISAPMRHDWLAFLVETEAAFSDGMRTLVRGLAPDKLVTDSQLPWGGTTALERERAGEPAGSDFIDTHHYWQHPSFIGEAWNPEHWLIGNGSMVEAFARGELGPLGLAIFRQAGVPFALSEVDQPAPSDWAVEMLPVIASYGAAQDWDAIYLFSSGNYASDNPGVGGFFDQIKHVSKGGQWPAAALIFREGLIPAIDASWTLDTPDPLWPAATNFGYAWNQAVDEATGGGLDASTILSRRLSLNPNGSENLTLQAEAGASPLRVLDDTEGLYIADSERAAVLVGHFGEEPIALEQIIVTPVADTSESVATGTKSPNFGAVTLVPLDDLPLSQSRRMLLTAISRAQNQEMGWNAERTSVGARWGSGPMMVQVPTLDVTLPQEGLAVYALSASGERKEKIRLDKANRVLRVKPAYETIYYELVAEE